MAASGTYKHDGGISNRFSDIFEHRCLALHFQFGVDPIGRLRDVEQLIVFRTIEVLLVALRYNFSLRCTILSFFSFENPPRNVSIFKSNLFTDTSFSTARRYAKTISGE